MLMFKKILVVVLLVLLVVFFFVYLFNIFDFKLNDSVYFLVGADIFNLGENSFQNGVLSITFDDGYLTQYENAFFLMKEYNFSGTLYLVVNSSRFFELENREVMSIENALEMQEAGWEIGAHSVNHPRLDKLSEEELIYELEHPIDFFKEYGINISSIAYPFGYHNDLVVFYTSNFFISGRVINDLNKDVDFYRLESKWVEKRHSPSEVCLWVSDAKKSNGWLILVFHSVDYNDVREYDYFVDDFKEILKCVNESGIEVMTIKDVVSELKGLE